MTAAGSPPPDPIEALRAALGSQYEVGPLLGQGGMGSVYLARDVNLDRPVAIKVINPDIASNQAMRERFLQEARTVARLRHPHIVPVHAAGASDSLLYFVMEFVSGESLRDVMSREGRLSGARAQRVLREVALALGHAHTHGLVHRDVKPENILIEQETGSAMLTDFGVARAFERDGGLTQAGMILGSPRYMSPEQASGDRAIDGRSDLYSLALVGYEMYTGEPVVQSGTPAGMLVKHITETAPPLAQRVTGVPLHVGAAIDRGLAKDPERRWQTGREFAEAISGRALTPTGEILGASLPGRPRRGKAAWIIAVTLAALAVGWWALGHRTAAGSGMIVAPFEIQSGEQSVAWLREGSVNMLTLTFGQWSDLKVVDYERTLSLLDAAGLGSKARLSLDDALRLAGRAGVATVVTGQVQTTRDSLIVVARLYNVGSGKSEHQAQEGAALSADPRPLFDRLAQQLLNIQGNHTSSMQLAQATTTSLEAYRDYLEGVSLLNAWRLPQADSAFAKAIALDSTFALAYYKRSLGLTWETIRDKRELQMSERAFALSGRLPPRERSLVEGLNHLNRALAVGADTATRRVEYLAAIKSYSDLISRGDSLAAEAWYGRADAYYHGAFGIPGMPKDSSQAYRTRSLRGFNRTLSIDSTFHLAYSHLIDMYSGAAGGNEMLISGDSALILTDTTVHRLGGEAAIDRIRAAAGDRGVVIARAWARADAESPQPILQLAKIYEAERRYDSSVAVFAAAMTKPALATPLFRMRLLSAQVMAGDTAGTTTARYVLDRYTPDSLRPGIDGAIMTALGASGRGTDVDRAAVLLSAVDSALPATTTRWAPLFELNRQAMHVALGDSVTPEIRRSLLQGMRWLDTLSGGIGAYLRGDSSIPYLAYLVTRDTAFRVFLDKWRGDTSAMPEVAAMTALARGDTAEARRQAQFMERPDSLRKPAVTFGFGGMRVAGRAIVWESIGSPRLAAETYDAVTVPRIYLSLFGEPGYPVWVRGLLDKARLWRELGENTKAIAAYEEFIGRWKNADGVAAQQVKEAVQELARLKDAPKKP